MSEEMIAALARIEERLANHVDRYDRDRIEITERVAADKKAQKEFRDSMILKVDVLEKKINPIVADHNRVKWLARAAGVGLITSAGGWVWETIKGHLK